MRGLVLVTGSHGLVGSRFVEISRCKKKFFTPKHVEFDIKNTNDVKNLISSYELSAIVNFAAYTDVGKAEEQRGDKDSLCWQVNVEGVRSLVSALNPYTDKIHFIQISTDMVFSGSKEDPGPYSEDHPIEESLENLTWYGYTKGTAENVVRSTLGDRASIVRIIYPVRAKFKDKLDYIRKPLKLFDKGKLYPMFSDQQITITYIDELCEALDKIIINNSKGTFHVCSGKLTTPYELISDVIKKARGKIKVVKPILLADFLNKTDLTNYRYQYYGGLSSTKTEKLLNNKFSDWDKVIDKLILQGLAEV